jgi:hypothetical protein
MSETVMSETEKLKKLIIEYELALRACERALEEAVFNENCGFGREYLTEQEIAEMKSTEASEKVRELALQLGIQFPKYKREKYEPVERYKR